MLEFHLNSVGEVSSVLEHGRSGKRKAQLLFCLLHALLFRACLSRKQIFPIRMRVQKCGSTSIFNAGRTGNLNVSAVRVQMWIVCMNIISG